jgi:capsular exopolysaccharide synthesis family protein
MNDDAPRYADLRDYLRVLRQHRVLIVALIVIAAGAALFFSARATPSYHATAVISFQDETELLALLGTSVLPGSAPDQTPAVRAQTIKSVPVLLAVKQALHTPLPIGALGGAISTKLDATAQLVNVTATSNKASFAAALANEFVGQVATQTTAEVKAQLSQAAQTLRRRLHGLGNSLVNQAERATLANEISRLEFLHANATPARVVALAAVPGVPVSPRPVRNAGLGALAGLLLGLIAAFVRDSLDRRLRTTDEIEAELGYPLIGHVRAEAMGRVVQPRDLAEPERAADVEAFRIIRQNLEFLGKDTPLRSIAVTSALPEEGKSTVAASLAFTIAAAGRRTLLIESDLRRPSLSGRLDLPVTPGLSDYLLGQARPEDVLRNVPMQLDGREDGDATGSALRQPILVCIAAGSPSGQSAELLASDRFRALLDEVSAVYDAVILDTAPLLPVADTLELLPRVDSVLLCVRAGRTTRDQARAAKAALEHFPPRPTGVVVTGLRPRDEPGYGLYPYYYSYVERVQA